MKIKKNWLEDIKTNNLSFKMSWCLFVQYRNQLELTQILYPHACKIRKEKNKKNFIMPQINKKFNEWKKMGLLNKSIPLKQNIFRKGKIHKQTFYKYLLNFNFFYRAIKEEYNINFNDKEKSFLEYYLLSEHARYEIIRQNPNDNLINAIIKFYIKNWLIYRDENLTNKILNKKLPKKLFEDKEKIKKLYINEIYKIYYFKKKEKPNFIEKIDNKMLFLLGINPEYPKY